MAVVACSVQRCCAMPAVSAKPQATPCQLALSCLRRSECEADLQSLLAGSKQQNLRSEKQINEEVVVCFWHVLHWFAPF